MVKSATAVTGLTLVARAVHFFLFVAIGNFYGATSQTDAVFFIYGLVSLIGSVAVSGTEVVLMPAIHKSEGLGLRNEFVFAFRRRIAIVTSSCSIVAAVFWILFSPTSVWTIAILCLAPTAMAFSAVHAQFLNSQEKFILVPLSFSLGGLCSLAVVVWFPSSSLSLAGSLVLYDAIATLALWLFSARDLKGARAPGAAAEILAPALRRATIQSVGSAVAAANPFVALMFASQFGAGAITIVEYAGRFWNGVPLLFAGALIVYYARASRAMATHGLTFAAVREEAIRFARWAMALTVLLIVAIPILLPMLYKPGRLPPESSALLVQVLTSYVIGTVPYMVVMVMARTISAMGKVHWLTVTAFMTLALNVVATAVLIRFFGLAGIGLSWTLVQTVLAVVLWRLVKRELPMS